MDENLHKHTLNTVSFFVKASWAVIMFFFLIAILFNLFGTTEGGDLRWTLIDWFWTDQKTTILQHILALCTRRDVLGAYLCTLKCPLWQNEAISLGLYWFKLFKWCSGWNSSTKRINKLEYGEMFKGNIRLFGWNVSSVAQLDNENGISMISYPNSRQSCSP